MRRRLFAVVALVVLALGACTDGAVEPAGSRVAPRDLAGMVLHLPDVPEGARIGDDSDCGHGLSADGATNTFLDLLIEARGEIVGCFNQLEAQGVFTYSTVLLFPDDDLAARALTPEAFAGIVDYYGLVCCNNEPVGPFAELDAPGTGALAASSSNDTAAVLGWRSGTVVGAVAVLRFDGTIGAMAEARRLATIQAQRMLAPVAVAIDIDDDRLVGLKAAPFQTWWLGETFSQPGQLGADLYSTGYRDGLVELNYSGIRIEIFDREIAEPAGETTQIVGVAGDLFDSPCTVVVPIEHSEGDAELVGRFVPDDFLGPPLPDRRGWGSLNEDTCPNGEPNIWMATVRLPEGLLVQINAPICYNCLVPPDPERPYREPEGLRSVVAALMRFEA